MPEGTHQGHFADDHSGAATQAWRGDAGTTVVQVAAAAAVAGTCSHR